LDKFVLPRWLRRPVRMFARLGEGDLKAPPYAATMLSAAFLASSVTYGAYLGGNLDGFVQGVTARTGFAVDQIKVVGNRETSEIDILDKLDLDGWTSLVGFNVETARERVATLPWVEGAAVRKIYPHTLEVRIEERQPFALWQQGSQLSVIERDGRVIVPYAGGNQATLPLLVGPGAPEHAPDFLARVAHYPELANRVRGYVRVGDRRWDLRLDNGITVKLPEEAEDAALAQLVALDREQSLLSRDIAAVDMRIPDRLALELTPEAMTARQAALKEISKAAKRKPEQKI
jgi:cell division protein FtsQ